MAEVFDLVVVGMGVGGEEVVTRTAGAGMKVLAIERKLVGGECPYWGCIPSKMMVRASIALAEGARVNGLAGSSTMSPDWAPLADRVREATAGWDDAAAVKRHEDAGARVLHGSARLLGPSEVEIDGERFSPRRGVVLATGTEPAIPPIEGLEDAGPWTNREAIEASERPESMVVLGAGPIGLELGMAYARFGARVSIIEAGDQPLPAEEPENGTAMRAVLEAEGISLYTGTAAESVKRSDGGVAVEISDGTLIAAEKLLVATGRTTDLGALGVDSVGLDPEAKSIDADGHLRAAERTWAVGDVTGKGNFTHVAVYQGRIAAADILEQEHMIADYSAVPRVTFTDPEVASVGLTEAEARARGLQVKSGIAETAASARGHIHGPGAEHGVTKLVVDAERNVLVGASVMGPMAGETISTLTLAVRGAVPLSILSNLIYAYPTFTRGIDDALSDLS
ncbi:MAG: NAD(P)/FAD-dependent oxidoreductase [Actinomycetota bacterium]|nr:NAD(P)/FAD-dependent oxidoreductase [Actinomycetota bacterium]